MRRLLTSILMITVFAMQSISFSHAHFPSGPEEVEHHSGQPHFHVHGGHSHAAHHKKTNRKSDEPVFAVILHEAHPVDHELDACYLPDSLSSSTRLTQIGDLRLWSVFMLDIDAERFDFSPFVRKHLVRQFVTCSGSSARVPLYLRSLAILC